MTPGRFRFERFSLDLRDRHRSIGAFRYAEGHPLRVGEANDAHDAPDSCWRITGRPGLAL